MHLYPYRTGTSPVPTRNSLFITQIEAFAETLNTTGGVENTLLTGEEWMAF